MFKNRIRTAAIAGIAALATSLAGTVVAAPAFAQDTLHAPNAPAGEYWVSQDASAAFDAAPVNHSELELKAASDITQKFLTEGAEQQWRELQSGLNWDPSEEARADDVRTMHESIIEEQKRNSANIKRIQESIAYAFQKDQEATDAWQALVERAHAISNEIHRADKAPVAMDQTDPATGATYGQPLYVPKGGDDTHRKPLSQFTSGEYYSIVELVNFYAVRDGGPSVPVPLKLSAAPTDAEVRDFYEDLMALIETEQFKAAYDAAGEFLYDESAEHRISRYNAEAIIELYDETEGYLAELDTLREASRAASREAQQSDVLVRQGFLMRAVAQRDLLRNWEGKALAWARYVELYNDPTLTMDRTLLSTEYRQVLDNLQAGIDRNTPLLTQLDEAVNQAFDRWSTDLKTNADVAETRDNIYGDWDFQIVEERIDDAATLYENILENGRIWREALNRVQALEIELAQPSDNDKLIEAIEKLAEGNGGTGEGDDNGSPIVTPAPSEDESSSSDVDGSSDFGFLGIAAVLAAILGVVAFIAPNLIGFL